MCDINGCGKQQDLPAIEISSEKRRLFLKGLTTLPLATVLFHSDLTHAAAASTKDVTIKLDDGTEVSAAVALPEGIEKAPTVILIHEWWGLNDQIKAVAADLAKQGYIALAVDLYSGATPATKPQEAKALMSAMDSNVATETMKAWVNWSRSQPRSTGKVATLGWCFGGGWSLNTSTAAAIDATVIYYGRVTQPSEELKKLTGPVMGHFGELDKNINQEMVAAFEAEMEKAGKAESLEVFWYPADHAFANPTGSRYDEENAAKAWDRTLQFLQKNL